MEVRALIADASASTAQAIARELDRRGFRTVTAQSCTEACDQPGPFDCGIISADLADGSGISLAGWLLAEDRVYSVVFFDEVSDPDLRSRMTNLGTIVAPTDGIDAVCDAVQERLRALGERARVVGDADRSSTGRREEKSGRRPKRFD